MEIKRIQEKIDKAIDLNSKTFMILLREFNIDSKIIFMALRNFKLLIMIEKDFQKNECNKEKLIDLEKIIDQSVADNKSIIDIAKLYKEDIN